MSNQIQAWWWIVRHPFKSAAIRRHLAEGRANVEPMPPISKRRDVYRFTAGDNHEW